MSTFDNRSRWSLLVAVLVFAVAFSPGFALATIVTPRPAVTHYVVVRADQSAQSGKLGEFNPGDQAEVIQSVPNWLKVRLADGTLGYVSKRWVTEITVAPSPAPNVAPAPLLSEGHPVDWWFVFKFNGSGTFSGCEPDVTRQCTFGGQVQTYTSYSEQFVYASSEGPELKKGVGCLGETNTDPLGATFGEIYNGSFHYVVWNDQFYNDPEIDGCDKACLTPWGHSKGMVAWDDSNEGLVMQVTTPSWPASGSHTAPRGTDGNTLGCVEDNNVKYSQHFFASRLTHDDLVKVLRALKNANAVTDPSNIQIVNNGGSQDVQDLVNSLGTQSNSSVPTAESLSSGIELIAKPSALHVPPWQMVSALLGGASLRVATWWSVSKINSTTATTPVGCWDTALGQPGPVEIATSGQWNGISFGLKGGANHAKIGVSTAGDHHYTIFGDMNQEGALSATTPSGCGVHQNGRGGLFFVIDNQALTRSVADLIKGDTAPGE